jgi:O-succinylbenzoate synthase
VKLERVNLYHLRMPLISPFETSFGRITTRDCIILEVYAGGIAGYGECVADRDPGYAYETSGTAWHILPDYIIPAVIDREIDGPMDIYSLTRQVRGHLMAKSGLEMALWDIQGKVEGRSLSQLIGGTRDRVEVGVSVGIQDSKTKLVDVVGAYLSQGYGRIKIKIKPGRDFEDTRAVRNSFPHIRLQVDANSAYTLDTAAELIHLDTLGLLLIEQPLAEDDLWDHSRLQSEMNTPLCLDESIISLRHARQALEMNACRIVNIKMGRVGGLSQALAIHDFCLNSSVPVWCGGMLETGVGRAANLALASLPGFTLPGDISATDRYYQQDITQERFTIDVDSMMFVPTAPGLGVNIDHQALQRFTINRLSIG